MRFCRELKLTQAKLAESLGVHPISSTYGYRSTGVCPVTNGPWKHQSLRCALLRQPASSSAALSLDRLARPGRHVEGMLPLKNTDKYSASVPFSSPTSASMGSVEKFLPPRPVSFSFSPHDIFSPLQHLVSAVRPHAICADPSYKKQVIPHSFL